VCVLQTIANLILKLYELLQNWLSSEILPNISYSWLVPIFQ
jgi:hypothetical protein